MESHLLIPGLAGERFSSYNQALRRDAGSIVHYAIGALSIHWLVMLNAGQLSRKKGSVFPVGSIGTCAIKWMSIYPFCFTLG